MTKTITILFAFSCIVAFCVTFLGACHPEKNDHHPAETLTSNPDGFTGSSSCKTCHAQAYSDWLASDHFKAMAVATDSTVSGDFNDATYTADGVTNRFFIRDGKYFINTEGPDGQQHDYEVAYTFGYYPLQQYLVQFPGGRMQASRVSWDARDKKWFHQYAGESIYHGDWLHWTGGGQNWNTMCASCHSTNLQKNYDAVTDAYQTTWSEINVSCESCHGPGAAHISFVQSANYTKGKPLHNMGLAYGRDTLNSIQINACASCHARKSDLTATYSPSGELMDQLIPEIITAEHYYADGQIRDEDYEYSSFTQSKMYHNNVRCSHCHNPHSGKLKFEGNALCLQCHLPKYDDTAHHHHSPGSNGALCINCHMAEKTYMGIDHRRDHSFRVPRPDQTVTYGTPNACHQCHADQKADWAADAIIKWYGPKRAHHFSDDLVPGSFFLPGSEGKLIRLLADTAQPAIARAAAARYLGNMTSQLSTVALRLALKDKAPIVRYHALRAMAGLSPSIWLEAAKAGLEDERKAVRLAAADLYHTLPKENLPADMVTLYEKRDAENRAFLESQLDFSIGNVMLADYALQGGNREEAIKYYERGLRKDSLMNYARFNLAVAYSQSGNNEDALRTLEMASIVDPQSDRALYSLGLVKYEMGDLKGALSDFDKAVQLGSQNPSLYYNYGLALQRDEQQKKSEKVLLQGYALAPQSGSINYALAIYYMQSNEAQKAIPFAATLKQIDPNNPDYQLLFKQTGL